MNGNDFFVDNNPILVPTTTRQQQQQRQQHQRQRQEESISSFLPFFSSSSFYGSHKKRIRVVSFSTLLILSLIIINHDGVEGAATTPSSSSSSSSSVASLTKTTNIVVRTKLYSSSSTTNIVSPLYERLSLRRNSSSPPYSSIRVWKDDSCFLLRGGGGGSTNDEEAHHREHGRRSNDDMISSSSATDLHFVAKDESTPSTDTTTTKNDASTGHDGDSNRSKSVPHSSSLRTAVLTTPHRRMPAVRIASGPRSPYTPPPHPGTKHLMMIAEPIFITKFTLAKRLGCSLRDLRIIDPKLAKGVYNTAFLPRQRCVVVHVGYVRAIVMRDEVLILYPAEEIDVEQPTSTGGSDNDVGGGEQEDNETELVTDLVSDLVHHLNDVYWTPSSSSHVTHPSRKDDPSWVDDYPLAHSAAGEHRDIPWDGWRSSTNNNDDDDGPKRRNKRNKPNKPTTRQKTLQPTAAPDVSTPQQQAPFELVVMDALMGHVCSHEALKANRIICAADELLAGIVPPSGGGGGGLDEENVNPLPKRRRRQRTEGFMTMQSKLGKLLLLKNKVDKLEAYCSEVSRAISDVLQNDDDMAAMRLSYTINEGMMDRNRENNILSNTDRIDKIELVNVQKRLV